MNVHPFTPAFKSTQKITVVGTSTAATNLMNANDPCVRITNSGGNDCFVNISSIATTCDDTDLIENLYCCLQGFGAISFCNSRFSKYCLVLYNW